MEKAITQYDIDQPTADFCCICICYNTRCKTCRFIKERTTSYTSLATNGQKIIRHNITCSSSNLLYMILCAKCKIQYIGETKRRLGDRFGEHQRAVEKPITQRDIDQPTAISNHFTLPGHSLNKLELIPLELINSNRDAIRSAREAFLIYKGKTLEPSRLNRLTKFNPFIFRLFLADWYTFPFFSTFVQRSCHIFPYYHFKNCNRHFYYFFYFYQPIMSHISLASF